MIWRIQKRHQRCMQHRGLTSQPCGTDEEATDETATDEEETDEEATDEEATDEEATDEEIIAGDKTKSN